MVQKLGITWHDLMSLVIDETLTIKRIKPLGLLTERRAEQQAESKEEALDNDFALMTLEFTAMFEHLIKWLGGLKPLSKAVAGTEEKQAA